MRIQEIDYSVNLLQSILWQYNDATNLKSLVGQKQGWYDLNQSAFWSDWYDDVFNLMTANQFGLAVWAIILNVPLFIDLSPESDDAPIFGFNEDPSINSYVNFNNFATSFIGSNFSSRGSVIVLSDEEQRIILRLRYYQLVSRGAIPEINQMLKNIFGSGAPTPPAYQGNAWVLDGFDMTMTYVFDFAIPKIMRTILVELDLLPRPAAVGLKYVVSTGTVFGFNERLSDSPIENLNSNQNFGYGNFFPEGF
jgi:hypothetical protein